MSGLPGSPDNLSLAHHVSKLLPLAGGARDAYVAQLAPDLAKELRALLAFESRAIDLSQAAGVAIARQLLQRTPPERLGRWAVVRPLGHGGMGSVFLVSREELGVSQTAAAKLAFVQQTSEAALAAIRREAEALSRLQHGNIATLLDFGLDAESTPFVVSEFIDGEQLLDYAGGSHLTSADRLGLFAQLLDGAAAAHAQLVLHLDIKPSNVLVTSAGVVKLIDFGLAGIMGGREAGAQRSIAAGYTQAYASPEQLAGEPVTVRSDVYSLGILLHELLYGCLPAATGAPISHDRAGEMAAVVGRAIAANPGDRYPNVIEFKQDLMALLEHRPVSPLANHRTYRGRKFLRRQWLPVSLAGAALVALGGGLLGITLQQQKTVAERDRALLLLESERATSDFITDSLRTASVFGGGDADTTVGDMVKHMVTTLPEAEKMSARSKSWLASDLAAVLTGLGDMELALAACRQAVEHAALSDDIEDDIAHWTQYALTAGLAHEYAIALEASDRARQLAEPIGHWRLPWAYLSQMQTLVTMKRWTEVVALWPVINAIPTQRRSVSGNIDYMRGTARTRLGDFEGATADLQRAAATYTELYGAASVPVADVLYRQFQNLVRSGRLTEAVNEVVALRTAFARAYGANHYRLAALEAEIAILNYYRGELPAAHRILTNAIGQLRERRGDDAPIAGYYQIQLARVLLAQGQVAAAGDAVAGALPRLTQLGSAHPDHAEALVTRGEVALFGNDLAGASTDFSRALALLASAAGHAPLAARAHLGLARAALAQDDIAGCQEQRMLLAGLPKPIHGLGPEHPSAISAANDRFDLCSSLKISDAVCAWNPNNRLEAKYSPRQGVALVVRIAAEMCRPGAAFECTHPRWERQ